MFRVGTQKEEGKIGEKIGVIVFKEKQSKIYIYRYKIV